MSDDLQARVINMVRENLEDGNELDNLKPDDDLSVLGINSVTFIKLVIAAEMEFGITWNEEDLDYRNFSTINNIVDYIIKSNQAS
jgi:acyl carrier protein